MNSTLKYILYGVGGLVIIGIILYAFIFYKGTVNINPNLTSAKITIGNQEKTGTTGFRLSPGKYYVKIEAEGYVTYEKQIEVKSAQTLTINLVLNQTPEPSKIVNEPSNFLTKGNSDSLLYLANGGKTIYQMSSLSDEKPTVIPATPDTLSDLTNIIWSPLRDLAIMKKTDISTVIYDFKRYDLLHQEIHSTQNGIGSVAWSPDGNSIAYYYNNSTSGETTIVKADKGNNSQERIYNLKTTTISNPRLDWSKDGNKILVYTNDIYILDTYTKDLAQLTQNESVNFAVFSPDSQYIIFSNKDGLFVMDLAGKNKRSLDAKTTANKIVFLTDNKTILAALPQTGKSDQLEKINYLNGEKIEYPFASTSIINVTNLTLLTDEKNLYFMSNGFIYSLDLTKGY